jgi:hypothetical protein
MRKSGYEVFYEENFPEHNDPTRSTPGALVSVPLTKRAVVSNFALPDFNPDRSGIIWERENITYFNSEFESNRHRDLMEDSTEWERGYIKLLKRFNEWLCIKTWGEISKRV